jgi:hypothetical protein
MLALQDAMLSGKLAVYRSEQTRLANEMKVGL